MTNIHMIQQDVKFTGYMEDNYAFRLVQSSYLSFPSNVINCSLSIIQKTLRRKDMQGPGNWISSLGAGINRVSYNGTQVLFDAWMQAFGVDSSNDLRSFISPNISYITVVAIAECE